MSYIDTYDVLKSEKTKVFCKQRDVVVRHHGMWFPVLGTLSEKQLSTATLGSAEKGSILIYCWVSPDAIVVCRPPSDPPPTS